MMAYTVEDFIRDLDKGRDWNDAVKCAREANLQTAALEPGQKKELSQAINRYFYERCPQEYKDHPEIHYDIPHFCRDGEIEK